MAKLAQQTLKADDCTKMIMSFWFKIPTLPKRDGPALPPADGQTQGELSFGMPNYLLLEFGEYAQISFKKYYPYHHSYVQTVAYDGTVFYHNPPGGTAVVGWFDRHAHAIPPLSFYYVYGALPGTPLGGSEGSQDNPVTQIYHSIAIGHPVPFPTNPIENITNIDVRWGEIEWKTDNQGNSLQTIGGEFWIEHEPSWGRVDGSIGEPQLVPADLFATEYKAFDNTYYSWDPPSSVSIQGSNTTSMQVVVRIAGAVNGPYSVGASNWAGPAGLGFLPGNISSQNPGFTIIPNLTVKAPQTTQFLEVGTPDNPSLGTEARPYVTVEKWHHVLCCVDLKGESMVEPFNYPEGVQGPTGTLPRYRSCVMWVLLDGVKYGGDPWPDDVPESDRIQGEVRPRADTNGELHESPQQDYSFPPTGAMFEIQDASFNRNGILVKDQPFSIPYHAKWKRVPPNEYEDEEMFTNTNRPFFWGWQGGDPDKATSVYVHPFDRTEPVPASQIDFPRFEEANQNAPPRTTDIKRNYSDLQIWFGKYIDPTKSENLGLFLEITRNPDDAEKDPGKLVGNIPELTQAEKDAYAAAQANDPNIKVLSKAAAPNNLGQPDVYLAGGSSSFIHDRGKEGDTMAKLGTIKDTPRPADIPIPENAVKPPNL